MPISNITITDRNNFIEHLKQNQTIIILKFGAEWCGPCNNIKNDVHELMVGMPDDVTCLDIDVDECFDVYAYLKSKKIVNGVPCVLAYFAGNIHYVPDEVVIGARMDDIRALFEKCRKKYAELQN